MLISKATDADQAGDRVAGELQTLAPRGAKLERLRPSAGKDWNDGAKAKKLEAGKRQQAALAMIEQIRKTRILNSQWASTNEEIMRMAFERYWQRLGREKRQALIDAAKSCRSAEELRNLSSDPAAAAMLAAQGDLLTRIEEEIKGREEPCECSVWANLSGKAYGLARERHYGDPLVDALAQSAGMQPAQAKQEYDKQKVVEAEIKEAMQKAQQRIAEKAARGQPPDPDDVKCLTECAAALGLRSGGMSSPQKTPGMSM